MTQNNSSWEDSMASGVNMPQTSSIAGAPIAPPQAAALPQGTPVAPPQAAATTQVNYTIPTPALPLGNHQQQASAAPPFAAKKPKTSSKSFLFGFLGALLACVLAFSGFGAVALVTNGFGYGSNNEADTATGGAGGVTLGASTSSDIKQVNEDTSLAEVVAKKALPSVVAIYTYTSQQSMTGMNGMFGFDSQKDSSSGGEEELVQSAMGSGVILSEDGYIITNYHVIEGAEKIEVSLDGVAEPVEATLVGADESSDIAVIKIDGVSGLTPIEIGDSSEMSVGEWVMALGSPYGLEQSVSTGIASALSRSYIMESSSGVTLYTNLIQTDAAINQGNSGGALVDADGKLVGINTLISSTSGDNSGVGFAIPADYAIGIAEDLINGKTPSHAQLGVSLSSVSSTTAERYQLSEAQGAYVEEVSSGSGAEAAGIRAGDVIISFDGTPITSTSDLMLAVRSMNPGDKVQVELNRSGETLTVDVTLGSDVS